MRSRNLGTSDGPERSIAFLAAASAVLYAAGGSVAPVAAGYAGEAAVVLTAFAVTASLTALYVDRTLTPGFWIAAPAASAAVPATAAVATDLLPTTTWTLAAVATAWAFALGAALAVATERRVDLRMPAYGVGFVLTGTVLAYLSFATLGLVVAVFVGDAAAFALGGIVAAGASYVYLRVTAVDGEWTAAAAASVVVVTAAAAATSAVPADVAVALTVVNLGFLAGALPLTNAGSLVEKVTPTST